MLVQFTVTGEIMDTDKATFQASANGPWPIPAITTPSGYTPVQGTETNRLGVLGIGGNYLAWFTSPTGTASARAKWEFTNAAAVATGITKITDALTAGDAFVTVTAAGA